MRDPKSRMHFHNHAEFLITYLGFRRKREWLNLQESLGLFRDFESLPLPFEKSCFPLAMRPEFVWAGEDAISYAARGLLSNI